MNSKGFTIIESLIVAVIFGTIGVIATDLLARTFQGSNKVRLISLIQQNGQSALSSIEQTIKFADDVVCPTDSNLSPMIITVSNGVYTRIKIVDSSLPSPNNNYIAQDNPTTSDASQPDFCDSGLSSSKTYLINKKSVAISNSGFVVNSVFGRNKSVTVQFDLSSINTNTSFENQTPPVSFRTTVQLR